MPTSHAYKKGSILVFTCDFAGKSAFIIVFRACFSAVMYPCNGQLHRLRASLRVHSCPLRRYFAIRRTRVDCVIPNAFAALRVVLCSEIAWVITFFSTFCKMSGNVSPFWNIGYASCLKLDANILPGTSCNVISSLWVHDAGCLGINAFRLMAESARTNQFKPRLYAMAINAEQIQLLLNKDLVSGDSDERFQIGAAKVLVDGASSGATMCTRQPYENKPDYNGILYYTQEQLNEILGEAHQKGFQITAHAMGDKAIEMLLDCFELTLSQHPRENHRHRIEHAGLSQPDLIKRMKELQVIPIPNPPFFYEYGETYEKLYGERAHHMFPLRDMLDNGIIATGSSDSPITSHNPLLGIYGAVTRKSKSGKVYGEHQRITVLEAIRMYTWNGAYASFEEGIKGSIEVGKLADLVVLNGSILNTEPDQIKAMQVEMTLINGEIVYSSTDLASGVK